MSMCCSSAVWDGGRYTFENGETDDTPPDGVYILDIDESSVKPRPRKQQAK